MSITDIRRENLKLLVARYGTQAELSRATGKAPAYIGQLAAGVRNLGEAASRDIERALGLPRDWFDHAHTAQHSLPSFPQEQWEALSAEARSLVMAVANFAQQATDSGESDLLAAYRACTTEGKAVVVSVAQAQAAVARAGRA